MKSRHRDVPQAQSGWDIALSGDKGEYSGLQSPRGTGDEEEPSRKVGHSDPPCGQTDTEPQQTLARTLLTPTAGPVDSPSE